jgi:radical SAM protein with 4Fe4S-binding SPASM domain
MSRGKVIIEANANFHHVAGEDLFERKNARFREYRRKWKEWPEKFHVGEFPLFIDVEVTSSCNLRCPFCATTFRKDVIAQGRMSFDTLRTIIDEGADRRLYGVKFNLRGEPLLHPRIADFVAYAKQKGLIDVYFNTNGTLLTDGKSRKLIDAGLDRISISFEGYTREVYERYRVGASFGRVLKNIEGLQNLKRTLGVDHPKVRIQTVLVPDVERDLEGYRTFWAARADEVAFLDYKEMKEKKTGVRFPWACPQLWQRMAIWWDGTILPCNHDDDGLLALGNVRETTIENAWHSDRLNLIRKLHRQGDSHEVDACDGCYLRDSEVARLKQT